MTNTTVRMTVSGDDCVSAVLHRVSQYDKHLQNTSVAVCADQFSQVWCRELHATTTSRSGFRFESGLTSGWLPWSTGVAPAYLAVDGQLVSDAGRRQLRSANSST